jgi:hypothetical protein
MPSLLNYILSASFALAAITCEAEAQDSDFEFLHDGWTIGQTAENDYCALLRQYDDNTYFGILFDARNQVVMISLENEFATSLNNGENVRLDMIIFTSVGNSTGDGWDGLSYSVSVDEDGSRRFISERLNPEVLDDLARHSNVGWMYRGNVVQSLALDGSARAIEALRDCSFEVAGLNRRDPFLN